MLGTWRLQTLLVRFNTSLAVKMYYNFPRSIAVREAGGVTMDPAGGPLDIMSRRVLAASSKELADDFCKLLTQYYPTPRDD